jgi:hypothetical protein
MNWTMFLPGLLLSILLFLMIYKKLNLPPIKFKKFNIDVEKYEEVIREVGLIGFFCLVFVGIKGFDWRIACIVCGIAGTWFFYPRKG